MNPIGLLPIGLAVFIFIVAGVCFRQAANPMAMLERMKNRYGVDYPSLVSDPEKYTQRMGSRKYVAAIFLCVVGIVMLIAGVIAMGMPTAAEQQKQKEAMRLSSQQMREAEYAREEANQREQMKHIFDVRPPANLPK